MPRFTVICLFTFSSSVGIAAPELVINGHMNKDKAAAIMAGKAHAIESCAKDLQKKHPGARGRINITMTVPTGKSRTSTCKVTTEPAFEDAALAECVKKNVCDAVFPAPKIDTEVQYLGITF